MPGTSTRDRLKLVRHEEHHANTPTLFVKTPYVGRHHHPGVEHTGQIPRIVEPCAGLQPVGERETVKIPHPVPAAGPVGPTAAPVPVDGRFASWRTRLISALRGLR